MTRDRGAPTVTICAISLQPSSLTVKLKAVCIMLDTHHALRIKSFFLIWQEKLSVDQPSPWHVMNASYYPSSLPGITSQKQRGVCCLKHHRVIEEAFGCSCYCSLSSQWQNTCVTSSPFICVNVFTLERSCLQFGNQFHCNKEYCVFSPAARNHDRVG